MSGVILGPKGTPISSRDYQNKKAPPPALGEKYGAWAGEETGMMKLPGGGAVAFDTSQLRLSDFRQMRGHYQINSSLSVLTFMMHQAEYHIEVTPKNGNTAQAKKIEAHLEENLYDIWSRLVRAQSQALWAGFSPSALEWENDTSGQRVVLNKIKDLLPEDCRVHWKKIKSTVPGDAPGSPSLTVTHSVYDGIDQFGSPRIPVENSYWYPLLMENGNYYGRRILESAFQPWFFSTLMHLFANRYYERFGEPVPIGRAPYEDEIDVGGKSVRGNQLMAMILQNLRNRSTVVLPNEKTSFGDETSPSYDYQIEYLESQMRGADFERYMTRLDEEMSLAMFTPILMMRTADVGSYNLGTQHSQVYQWMLNAISGDWALYINKYILEPMVRYNFGENAPTARIKFMKMGKIHKETLQAIVTQLVSKGAIKPDIREIAEFTGMTFEEIEQVDDAPAPLPEEEETDPNEENASDKVLHLIKNRTRHQTVRAFRKNDFERLSLGYKRQLTDALRKEGFENADKRVADLYSKMDEVCGVMTSLGVKEYKNAAQFNEILERRLENELYSVKAA